MLIVNSVGVTTSARLKIMLFPESVPIVLPAVYAVSRVTPPVHPEQEATVSTPAEVREYVPFEKILSHPVPTFNAVEVIVPDSVKFPIFNPFTISVPAEEV